MATVKGGAEPVPRRCSHQLHMGKSGFHSSLLRRGGLAGKSRCPSSACHSCLCASSPSTADRRELPSGFLSAPEPQNTVRPSFTSPTPCSLRWEGCPSHPRVHFATTLEMLPSQGHVAPTSCRLSSTRLLPPACSPQPGASPPARTRVGSPDFLSCHP